MTTATLADMSGRDRSRDRAQVRAWLYAVALLIVVMVVVGGATRLTESGLSITEWQPIHGVIPPLDEAEWQEEFAKYQAIPEYQLLNQGMTLAEFKGIFWWEWAHRLLGRLIGVAFLVPFLFLWATGRIERSLVPRLAIVFVLGGLQGFVGWWMVQSGLVERTDVSQYRLAVHLMLACVILAYVLWLAAGLRERETDAPAGLKAAAGIILALVFVQIFLGAIVAGLDAGHVSDTWPLMNGEVIPTTLFLQEPAWLNLFENPVTAQFDHRLVAYVLFILALAHAFQARGSRYALHAVVLAGAVTVQAGVGIATVVTGMSLHVAITHQLGAVIVLALAVIHLRAMVTSPWATAPRRATA